MTRRYHILDRLSQGDTGQDPRGSNPDRRLHRASAQKSQWRFRASFEQRTKKRKRGTDPYLDGYEDFESKRPRVPPAKTKGMDARQGRAYWLRGWRAAKWESQEQKRKSA